MRALLIVVGILLGSVPAVLRADTVNVAERAFRQASDLNRPVLLVFSGSDWCLPCISFHRQILSNQVFQDFADKALVVLKADFPQRTALAPELVEQNEKLAEQYNPAGLFPHILLLNSDRSVLAQMSWANQTVEAFTNQVQALLPERVPEPFLREYRQSATLMGCGFEFTIVGSDSARAVELLQESIREVRRIENFLSEWRDTTETSRINQAAGKHPVVVNPELYNLLQRSLHISRLTQGAFDVSFAGVGTLWKFDGSQQTLPDSSVVQTLLGTVGYQKIQLLDSFQVYLPEEGMKVGFGSIGKGFAADRVKALLEAHGVHSGVINASGDLIAWGTRADGSPWKVGIADPQWREKILLWLPVGNRAVATSGNYEKFFEVNGVRYAHILDPRTGYPVQGVQSVTVISPSAELSDALATSVFVLGVDVGLNLINQLPDTECIIIDVENNAHYSKDLKL